MTMPIQCVVPHYLRLQSHHHEDGVHGYHFSTACFLDCLPFFAAGAAPSSVLGIFELILFQRLPNLSNSLSHQEAYIE